MSTHSPGDFASAPTDERPTGLAAFCAWAVRTYGPGLVLATSLGKEDMVLLHALSAACEASAITEGPRAFLLDTGRLHEKTYAFFDLVRERYAIPIDVYLPDGPSVAALVQAQGAYGFRRSLEERRACCHVRKVEPLGRALAGRAAWMTGLRRAQSQTRAGVTLASHDADHGLVKLAPLAAWSDEDVHAYLREHQVPAHPLHAVGYPSIGCEPCTRAIQEGEAQRAGRWWWEDPENKECGLHLSPLHRDAD